jgi:ABC-type uncharacterized transport system auxiliary subunit
MRKAFGAAYAAVLLLGCVLAAGGCAGAPELRYYRVALAAPQAEGEPAPVRLGIGRFAAAEPTRQERILYRDSPYRLQYYGADRWEIPPATMVQSALVDRLRASGRFLRVVDAGSDPVDARLDVRLQTFEEVDEGDIWFGEVALAFEVLAPDGRIMAQGASRHRVRAERRSVEAVVAALSQALGACLDEMADRTAAAVRPR